MIRMMWVVCPFVSGDPLWQPGAGGHFHADGWMWVSVRPARQM